MIMDVETIKSAYDKIYFHMLCVRLRYVTGIPLSFSNLNFIVEKQFNEDGTDACLRIRQGTLLKRRKDARHENAAESVEEKDIEEVDFSDEAIQEAMRQLQDCCSDDNLESLQKAFSRRDITETELQVAVGIHLVQKLTGTVHGNSSCKNVPCPCGCKKTVPVGDMWIGSSTSWHGQLDLLGGATSLSVQTGDEDIDEGDGDIEEDEENDDEGIGDTTDSPGDHSNVEIKQSQVIAQSIVYAWTEYNRHPDLSPFIPSILVGFSGVFVPYIYNPETDELLILPHTIRFVDNVSENSKDKFLYHIHLLWVFLNHRLFFMNKCKRINAPSKSEFVDEMIREKNIEKFKSMKHLSANEITVKRGIHELYQGCEVSVPLYSA